MDRNTFFYYYLESVESCEIQMAIIEHLEAFKQQTQKWVEWREGHKTVLPDLSNIVIEQDGTKNLDADATLSNLQSSFLDNCDFTDSTFRGVNLNLGSMTNAVLNNVNFVECSLDFKVLENSKPNNLTFTNCRFRGGMNNVVEYAGSSFLNCSFDGCSISKIDFREIQINEGSFRKCSFIESIVSGVDFSGLDFGGGSFDRVELVGTNFSQSALIEANFVNCDLTQALIPGADFSGAKLTWSILSGMDFSVATWCNTKFHKATIQGVDFRQIDFSDASFDETDFANSSFKDGIFSRTNISKTDFSSLNIRDCDFSDSTFQTNNIKLSTNHFGGTRILGATLPEEIGKFGALEHVAETSKHARNVFIALIGACFYSLLTVLTTTDVALLTNSTSTPLPIINAAMPAKYFYMAVPAVLLFLYFYLHFYLQTMWEELSGLPAIFHDGRRLDKVAYPWMLTSMVPRYMHFLRGEREGFSALKEFFSIAAAFGLVPVTIFLVWVRFLPAHELSSTILIGGLCVIATLFGLFAFFNMRTTLKTGVGHHKTKVAAKKIWKMSASHPIDFFFKNLVPVLISFALVGSAWFLSWSAIYGTNHSSRWSWFLVAGLEDAEVSTKPAGWSDVILSDAPLGYPTDNINSVKGKYWDNSNLRGAAAQYVFLINAHLQKADLSFGNFWRGKFQQTDLDNSTLIRSDFTEAYLQSAKLRYVDAKGAIFKKAHLYKASFKYAWLNNADMQCVDAREAHFNKAFLIKTDFVGADLSGAKFIGAYMAETMLGLSNVTGADFSEAIGLSPTAFDGTCIDPGGAIPLGVKERTWARCVADWKPVCRP